MNETIQYIIIAVILAGCIYLTVKTFKKKSSGGCHCSRCDFKENCAKRLQKRK